MFRILACSLVLGVGCAGTGAVRSSEAEAGAGQAAASSQPTADPTVFDLVVVLRPLVEKHSGLEFLAEPVLRVPDERGWVDAVHAEMPNAPDPELAVVTTRGLFLAGSREILLSPMLVHELKSEQRSQRAQEAVSNVARCVLAHELVHCLQEQHYQLCSRVRAEKDADKKSVLRALAEGHALVIEERIAEAELGIQGHWEKSRRNLPMRTHTHYRLGRSFVRKVLAEEDGEQRLAQAMNGKPPSRAELLLIASLPAPRKTKGPAEPAARR